MATITIFVTYDTEHAGLPRIASPVYVPLLCGAGSQPLPPGFCGDNSGDNLSLHYPSYGRFTGWYWVLKNCLPQCDADYVGLGEHNIFLNFAAQGVQNAPAVHTSEPSTIYYYRYFFAMSSTPQALLQRIGGADIVLPQTLERDNCSIRTVFDYFYPSCEMDRALEVLARLYPEYLPTATRILNGRFEYPYVCPVMRRALLGEYLQWCLQIFTALQDGNRWQEYADDEKLRGMPTHILSCLFNVWLAFQREHRSLQVLELPALHLLYDQECLTHPDVILNPILRIAASGCSEAMFGILLDGFMHMDPDTRTYCCALALRRNPHHELLLKIMQAEPGQITLRQVQMMLRS